MGKKTRHHGDGTVIPWLRGGAQSKFRAAFYVDRKRLYAYGPTAPSALAKARKMVREYKSSLDLKGSRQPLGDFIEEIWVPGLQTFYDSANTIEAYKYATRLIPKTLRAVPLGYVKKSDIQSAYQLLRDQGKGTNVVARVHKMLGLIFKLGQKWGYVAESPMTGITIEKHHAREGISLTPAEVKRLLTAVEKIARWHTRELYIIALDTGIRGGELFGLTWDNVDLQEGILTIARQVQKLKEGKEEKVTAKRQRGLIKPKSDAGVRRIRVGRLSLAALHRQQAALVANRKPTWPAAWDALVFRTANGLPVDHSALYRDVLKLRTETGIAFNFHDTRHTNTSMGVLAGVPIAVMSKRLGHAGTKMTATYTHTRVEDQSGASVVLGEILER